MVGEPATIDLGADRYQPDAGARARTVGADSDGLVVLGTTGPGHCRPYTPYLFCENDQVLTAWRIGGHGG